MRRVLKGPLVAFIMSMPALVVAQTTSLQPLTIRWAGDETATTYSFNASSCADPSTTLVWAYNGSLGSNFTTPLTFWATTSASCSTTPGSSDLQYTSASVPFVSVVALRRGTFTIEIAKLPGFNVPDGDGGTTVHCGDQGVEVTHHICGAITYSAYLGQTGTPYQASDLTILYDTKAPSAPTISDAGSLDEGAYVEFTSDSDTVTARGLFRVADAGAAWSESALITTASTRKLVLRNLTNNVPYEIAVVAFDQANNESVASSSVVVTPVHTVGFFELLRNNGSTEQGGCAVAGSMVFPLAALALVRAWARRSRR